MMKQHSGVRRVAIDVTRPQTKHQMNDADTFHTFKYSDTGGDGAVREQQVNALTVLEHSSNVQWSSTIIIFLVEIGMSADEKKNALHVAMLARSMHSSPAMPVRQVQICTAI